MFVDLAKDYVINNSFWPIDSMIDIFDEYLYIHHYTGPYVSVQWGQDYAEGELCVNGRSGCGATAMAQVMTHFEYPTSMSYTYPDPDITSQTLDWSSIKSHNTKHYLYNCSTESMDTHKSISRLCRQLGQIAQSYYVIGGNTWTNTNMVNTTMQYYGYNTIGWENYNSGNVCNKLDDGEVIIMYGNNNGENGHFWIVDGYDDLEYYIYTYMYVHGRDHAELTDVFGPFTETLNHINWGWYGINNGYFSVNVFNTSYVQFPDTNNNYANLTFNNALMTLSVSLE